MVRLNDQRLKIIFGLVLSFNSKMVRLNGASLQDTLEEITKFQFQDGSIKCDILTTFSSLVPGFNSKMVRLNGWLIANVSGVPAGFNSKMVRLNGCLLNQLLLFLSWFQFQDGSIKCPIVTNGKKVGIMFQFQDGSIKCCIFSPLHKQYT